MVRVKERILFYDDVAAVGTKRFPYNNDSDETMVVVAQRECT